jgi:squalene cyclase
MPNATDFLLQAQNADGGWGYRVRGMSYVEPTAAVLLALSDPTVRARGRDFLLSLQHADGGWGIAALDSESGWMTAWATRALADFPETRAAVTRGAQWLLATEGLRVTDPDARRIILELHKIDSALGAWPWQPGDAAWVHPTALAMLALAATGEPAHARVRDGVKYLFDRACTEGGWNIGNPWMLDKQIPATIQDTAVVLRALRAVGESASNAYVAAALRILRDALARAKTPVELAWGIFALRDWNVDVGDAIARLNALQSADGSWSGNPFITATAVASQK